MKYTNRGLDVTYREYVFYDTNLRKSNFDLSKFEYDIKKAYYKVAPWVKVEVEKDKYIVYGRLSRPKIQEVAELISSGKELSRYRVFKYYNGKECRYLFKCNYSR